MAWRAPAGPCALAAMMCALVMSGSMAVWADPRAWPGLMGGSRGPMVQVDSQAWTQLQQALAAGHSAVERLRLQVLRCEAGPSFPKQGGEDHRLVTAVAAGLAVLACLWAAAERQRRHGQQSRHAVALDELTCLFQDRDRRWVATTEEAAIMLQHNAALREQLQAAAQELQRLQAAGVPAAAGADCSDDDAARSPTKDQKTPQTRPLQAAQGSPAKGSASPGAASSVQRNLSAGMHAAGSPLAASSPPAALRQGAPAPPHAERREAGSAAPAAAAAHPQQPLHTPPPSSHGPAAGEAREPAAQQSAHPLQQVDSLSSQLSSALKAVIDMAQANVAVMHQAAAAMGASPNAAAAASPQQLHGPSSEISTVGLPLGTPPCPMSVPLPAGMEGHVQGRARGSGQRLDFDHTFSGSADAGPLVAAYGGTPASDASVKTSSGPSPLARHDSASSRAPGTGGTPVGPGAAAGFGAASLLAASILSQGCASAPNSVGSAGGGRRTSEKLAAIKEQLQVNKMLQTSPRPLSISGGPSPLASERAPSVGLLASSPLASPVPPHLRL